MSEMVERVAKAIYVSEIGSDAGWDDTRVVKARHLWLAKARAAIGAMREPTELMVKSGYREDSEGANDEDTADQWRRMIDEALK